MLGVIQPTSFDPGHHGHHLWGSIISPPWAHRTKAAKNQCSCPCQDHPPPGVIQLTSLDPGHHGHQPWGEHHQSTMWSQDKGCREPMLVPSSRPPTNAKKKIQCHLILGCMLWCLWQLTLHSPKAQSLSTNWSFSELLWRRWSKNLEVSDFLCCKLTLGCGPPNLPHQEVARTTIGVGSKL